MNNKYQKFLNYYTSPYTFFIILFTIFFSYCYLDIPIAAYMQLLEVSKINYAANIITNFGDETYFLIFISFLTILIIYFKKITYLPKILFVFSSFLISGALCDIIKVLAGRARPNLLFYNHDYGFYFLKTKALFLSFPSGHTTTAAAIAMACSLLLPRFSPLFFTYAVTIAISRIILNAHYLSDVIAGFYLGSIVVFLWGQWLNKIGDLELSLVE